jgi:excisionase family DNA binding protein
METLDAGTAGRPRGRKQARRGRPARAAPLTMGVVEAGKKYLGLGKHASYRAAQRGEIPTIKVGSIMRVPVAAMERLLDRQRSTLENA